MTNASEMLGALAEPTRRVILERLVAQPSAVSDIAREMPISRSAVSQHLQILKSVGLVTDHAEGTRRIYQVDPEALAIIRSYFDAFWKKISRLLPGRGPTPEGDPMRTTDATTVTTTVEVDAPVARAFHVFTAEIGTWWDDD